MQVRNILSAAIFGCLQPAYDSFVTHSTFRRRRRSCINAGFLQILLMRRCAAQRLKPLLTPAASTCEASCGRRLYPTDLYEPVSRASAASSFIRSESGRHAAASGRRLRVTSPQPSSRSFGTAAGGGWTSSGLALAGPARWGGSLRPLAASALGSGWGHDAWLAQTPPAQHNVACGFASHSIGRITPDGFTEKAWEVNRHRYMLEEHVPQSLSLSLERGRRQIRHIT